MKITICRVGSKYRLNRGSKGQFTKNFDSIEQLAKFIRDHWRVLFYPNLRNELTKTQLISLNMKINALNRIERKSL